MLIDIIAEFGLANNYIYEQIKTTSLQKVCKFSTLLDVSALRHHPWGLFNTKQHKHQYFSLEIQCDILRYLKR
jgi:hypothetical protein